MIWGRSGTSRRLLLAFSALLTVFGAAGYLGMVGMIQVHDLLHAVKEREAGVRAALELASAVRDQYAHQAHTIILGNDTHLGFYRDSRDRVLVLTKNVRKFTERSDEATWVADIERSSAELDVIFQKRILPAVLEDNRPVILEEHARAQELVSLIQDRADRLASRFETAIGDFETHAATVQHGTFRWSLIFFITALVVAAALGLYVGNSVARPMAKLEAGAARLAAGHLDTRIDLDTPDEFGRLAAQFNRMTASLEEHQAWLVESEKLAGIGRLAAGVAHEINNPLAVILGYVRILSRKASAADITNDLTIVESEAVRCQQIVEGLLELARPGRAAQDELSLKRTIEEVVGLLQDAGRLAPPASIEIEGSAGMVRGDAQKLRQVLTNLIVNAIDAAGEQGRIEVLIEEEPGEVSVSVSDDGPGISAEHRRHLFEPFFTTKPRGTGLGLAISKSIAQAHGGDIDAENRPGGGALFELRLPVNRGGRDG